MARDHPLAGIEFPRHARASGSEVAYRVHLTFALEMLSKNRFAILNQMCQELLPRLDALVGSVETLWVAETKREAGKEAIPEPRAEA